MRAARVPCCSSLVLGLMSLGLMTPSGCARVLEAPRRGGDGAAAEMTTPTVDAVESDATRRGLVVTQTPQRVLAHDLTADGDGYAVAWVRLRALETKPELMLARSSAAGAVRLLETVALPLQAATSVLRLFGRAPGLVVFLRGPDRDSPLQALRLSTEGQPEGSLIEVARPLDLKSPGAGIALDGSEFGVLFVRSDHPTDRVLFLRVSPSLAASAPPVVVNAAGEVDQRDPALAWMPGRGEFVAVWANDKEIRWARLGAHGERLAAEASLSPTAAPASKLRVVASDDAALVGWGEDRIRRLCYLPASGEPWCSAQLLPANRHDSPDFALALAADSALAAWETDLETALARIDLGRIHPLAASPQLAVLDSPSPPARAGEKPGLALGTAGLGLTYRVVGGGTELLQLTCYPRLW